MSKEKLEMIDFAGIPLPGSYPGLKGIELWGDGEVFVKKEKKKKKEKKIQSDVAARVAEKGLASPIFVKENGEVYPYDEFVGLFGEVVTEEGYQIITEVFQDMGLDYSQEEDEPYLYQFSESTGGSPFFNNWYPQILNAMGKASSKTAIHKLLSGFIDRNSEALSVRYPTTNIMLGSNEIDHVLHIGSMNADTTKEAVTELLANLDANSDFKSISKSPHQVIFTAMMIAAMEMGEEKLADDMITLVAFTMYPLIFRKYFPVTNPNPRAMEEVVITASKKFYIAKTKNLLEWIRILTTVPVDFYKEKFKNPKKDDKLIITFLNRLRNTMNQQFKSLYGVYKKAYDNQSIGKQTDEDFITLGSNQDKVHIYTMGIVDRINGMRFNGKICRAAAEYTRTDQGKVEKYVREYLRDTQEYGLKEYVENMLTIYFAMGQHNEFLTVAIKQYPRIFSSKDKLYNDFRDYLERIEKKFLDFDKTYLHRYLFGVYMYFAILTNIGMNQISNKLSELSLNQATAKVSQTKEKEES